MNGEDRKMPPKRAPKNSGKKNGKKEFMWSDDEAELLLNVTLDHKGVLDHVSMA